MTECPDLTVEEIVADPIVRALMSADRVDPAAFEALLRSRASKSLVPPERGPGPETHRRSEPAASAFRSA